MPQFKSFDGISIFYALEEGSGRPIVLLHGFAADTNINWVRSGVFDALVDEGHTVIAPDARGHGLSEKPHEPEAYGDQTAARDVQALLDEIEAEACSIVGYSMGARTALQAAVLDHRVQAAALVGVGSNLLERREPIPLAEALLADDPSTVDNAQAREFRRLADSVGADRQALAALARAIPSDLVAMVDEVSVPLLVLGGADDVLAGSAADLAERIAGAMAVTVPGNHFNMLSQPQLHRALLDFLRR